MTTSDSNVRYNKLDDEEIIEESSGSTSSLLSTQSHMKPHKYIDIPRSALAKLLVGSFFLNVILASVILYILSQGATGALCGQLAYSPAQDALRYMPLLFRTGFGNDISIYQKEPSPEIDQAWKELYDDWGIFRMNRDDAARIPNKTYPYPGDPGYYIGELAIAHQLHCLNRLRQGLFPEYYKKLYSPEDFGEDGTFGWGHLSHCIESVRQALTCASDISVVAWTWDSSHQRAAGYLDIVHSCRDFDKIKSWAQQHQPVLGFDGSVYIEDDLARYI